MELMQRVENKYGFFASFFCAMVIFISFMILFVATLAYFPWALLLLPATAFYMIWSVRNE